MTRDEAYKLRAIVEKASASLDDRDASMGAVLFPRMKYDGALIKAGTRICWAGTIKKAAVDLWDTEENSPYNAPTLWADVDYVDGVRKIPGTASGIFDVSAQFAEGEEGYNAADGLVYISLVNGNVYTPQLVPGNWKVREA